MDSNLILVLFIGFASVVVGFAIVFAIVLMLRESREGKKKDDKFQEQIAKYDELLEKMVEVQKKMAEQPIANIPVAENKIEEKEVVEDKADDNNVSFNAVQTKTLEEKYALLPAKYRKYYDEIAKYAQTFEGHKVIKNNRYEEYKIASARLVRLVIKRETVIAEFIISNFEFKNYVSENKVGVKQTPTQIKILDEDSVKFAKDTIDISFKAYQEEKEMKKALAKEKRKAKQKQNN